MNETVKNLPLHFGSRAGLIVPREGFLAPGQPHTLGSTYESDVMDVSMGSMRLEMDAAQGHAEASSMRLIGRAQGRLPPACGRSTIKASRYTQSIIAWVMLAMLQEIINDASVKTAVCTDQAA
jgi:hypothetical protein